MKKHDSVSDIPLINVGSVSVPNLILGHLPFVGESYQGAEKNREYCERFLKVENTANILKKAVKEYGITVIASTPSTEGKLAALLLKAIRKTVKATSVEIALIPCFSIPLTVSDKPIDDYRRWITYYEIKRKNTCQELLKRYIEDPILQCREGWEEKFPKALKQLPPYNREEIKALKIDYKRLEEGIRSLSGFKVLIAEPGSETDFIAMTGRFDLLEDFVGTLRGRLNCPVFVATHHAGSTIPILDESKVKIDGYLTPINSLGVMMFPSQETAIRAIKGTKRPVIAIKPLAGGRIRPLEAFRYVYREQKINACMVGVGSESELDEDLRAVKSVLEGG
jgi:hypothetical protein